MRPCGSRSTRFGFFSISRQALPFLFLSLLTSPLMATTIVAPSDDELIAKSSLIITGTVLSSNTVESSGKLFTETTLEVASVIAGTADGVVTVRHGGGRTESRARVVFGSPEFVRGEKVMLFLSEAEDGTYVTNDLFLGKFSERKTVDGGRVWYRSADSTGTTLLDGNLRKTHSTKELQRHAGAFEAFVRDRAAGGNPSSEYFLVNPVLEPTESLSFATLAEHDIHRWFRFDDGGEVEWNPVGEQGGYDRGGVRELEKALRVWSDYPATRIRFSVGAPVEKTVPASARNEINEILFNDPFNEIFGRWNGQSGVLAQAEYHAVKVNRAWSAPFDAGQDHPAKTYPEVWEIVEGNIVIQDGVSPFNRIGDVMLAQIIAHELGHALGLAHSRDSDALMSSTIDGTGAYLREDDQLAVRWLYPVTPATAPLPAPELTPVTVDFAVSKEFAEVAESLQLVDLSKGSPVKWEWSFGDGRTSTEKNPVHHYESPGTYLVTLSASNGSFTSSRSRSVVVTTEPQVHSLIPVATQTNGAGGTKWRTELALFNSGEQETVVTLVYISQAGESWLTTTVALSAGESVSYDNALPELFGVESGLGAIEVSTNLTQDPESIRISSRTFTGADDGTYGQSVPRLLAPDSLNYITGIESNASFRTNVGLVNRSLSSISAEVSLLTSSGTVIETVTLEIDGRSFRQLPLSVLFPKVAGLSEEALSLRIEASRGGALSSYASVVDNLSNDPFLVPGTPIGRRNVIVPGVAHTAGAGGTFWRTDITLFNPSNQAMDVELGMLGSDQRRSVAIEPGHTTAIRDVVKWLDTNATQGALKVTSISEAGPVISARTYTSNQEDATFGQWVQQSDPTTWGETASITGVKSNARFRTNAGIVNSTRTGTWVDLSLSSGGRTASARIFMEAQTQSQFALESQFAGFQIDSGATLLARSEEGIPIIIYGSVVDNLSGDPTFLSGR